MTKIEILQSQSSLQDKIDMVFDELISYVQNCTKEKIKHILKMQYGHQSDEITLIQDRILQDLGVTIDYNNINYSNNDNNQANDDPVNHPSYYADGNIEVIDYIEDKNLGYHLGTAIKYISRAGKKHEQGMTDKEKEIQDLQKAVWFINRKIDQLKSEWKDEN